MVSSSAIENKECLEYLPAKFHNELIIWYGTVSTHYQGYM